MKINFPKSYVKADIITSLVLQVSLRKRISIFVRFPMSVSDKFTYMQSEYNRLTVASKVHSKASYLIIKLQASFKPPKIMTTDTLR